MKKNSIFAIKRAQKSSLLLRSISNLFMKVAMDDARLQSIYVNRIELSPDKSHCYVYFCALGGETEFNDKLGTLILYKPSLRAALAQTIPSRYTPEIMFKFDTSAEKTQRIEMILEKIKHENDNLEHNDQDENDHSDQDTLHEQEEDDEENIEDANA
ncbi:hypothetical protein EBU24_02640 [bacterium]|nr:hypothetical protein [bacterium]